MRQKPNKIITFNLQWHWKVPLYFPLVLAFNRSINPDTPPIKKQNKKNRKRKLSHNKKNRIIKSQKTYSHNFSESKNKLVEKEKSDHHDHLVQISRFFLYKFNIRAILINNRIKIIQITNLILYKKKMTVAVKIYYFYSFRKFKLNSKLKL